tara:strand:- start:3180 stop:3467 length:288 start_codon:yes stop_codon:yes gene_type:complete
MRKYTSQKLFGYNLRMMIRLVVLFGIGAGGVQRYNLRFAERFRPGAGAKLHEFNAGIKMGWVSGFIEKGRFTGLIGIRMDASSTFKIMLPGREMD